MDKIHKTQLEIFTDLLLRTKIPFEVRDAIPGGYQIHETAGRSRFYIIFCWEHKGAKYDVDTLVQQLSGPIGKSRVNKGSGFLYYAFKNYGLWDYCLYASVECDAADDGELVELARLAEAVLKLKSTRTSLRYDASVLAKKLDELKSAGIVTKHKKIALVDYADLKVNPSTRLGKDYVAALTKALKKTNKPKTKTCLT